MSVSYQLRILSSFFQRIENELTHVVATNQGKMFVIVTILVGLVDSRPLRYEHWKGQLYDVKISRHLNVHWGQQYALFGFIQVICGQQHVIGCLIGVCGMKMRNTKSKVCFLKVRLYVLTKNGHLYRYHCVTFSCFLLPLRNPPATQQVFNSSFRNILLLNNFPRARLNEFKKVGKFVTF